jgi:hypothetical protein
MHNAGILVIESGANPTIVKYNASVVETYIIRNLDLEHAHWKKRAIFFQLVSWHPILW